MLSLIITSADKPAKTVVLKSSRIVVGREAECDIRLDDPRASRKHCRIERSPDCRYRVVDLETRNGTTVNGMIISATTILNDGDIVRVGDTTLRVAFMSASKNRWIPARPIYASIIVVLFCALIAVFALFGLDPAREHWGIARKLESALGDSIYRTSSLPSSNREPVFLPWEEKKELRKPSVPRPAEIREIPRGADFEELAQRAISSLRQEITEALSAGDIAKADQAIMDYNSGPFRLMKTTELWEMEKVVADFKNGREKAERERLAAIEKRFKSVESAVNALLDEEKFNEAAKALQALSDDPQLADRASTLRRHIEECKAQLIQRLPARCELFAKMMLNLRHLLRKRDYTGAERFIANSLMSDPAYTSHKIVPTQERERLGKMAALYDRIAQAIRKLPKEATPKVVRKDGRSIPISEANPIDISIANLHPFAGITPSDRLTFADLLLADEDFASAAKTAGEAILEGNSTAVNEFFTRLTMVRNAFMEEDIRFASARAEELSAKGKLKEAEEIIRKVTERYAVGGGDGIAMPPALDAVLKKLDELRDRLMVGAIPLKTLKILSEQGSIEQKVSLLRNLKVVGGKETIPYLRLAMKDQSSRVRLEAIRAFSICASKGEGWDLVQMFDDPVIEVGLAAVEALQKVGGLDHAVVTEKARGTDVRERRLAIVAAGALKEEKLAGLARKGLEDENSGVRKSSAITIAKLEDKGSGSALVGALQKEKEEDVHAAIAYALGAIKYTGGIAPLAEILKSIPMHRFRKEIIEAIGKIGGGDSAKVLKPYTRDIDPWVRYTAVAALGESRAKVTLDDVKHLLADDNWLNRAETVKTLSTGASDDKSLDAIVLMLDDSESAVRATAHYALLTSKNEKVVPAVIKRLGDFSGEGGRLALDILKRLTKQSYGEKSAWEAWWKQNKTAFHLPPVEERLKREGERPK